MEEVRRVFANRKLLLVFLGLWILNGWFVYQSMQPEKEVKQFQKENYAGNYEKDELKIYLDLLEEYREQEPELVQEQMAEYQENYLDKLYHMQENGTAQENTEITKESLTISAMNELEQQITYITGYQSYLADIKQNAEEMKELSLLGSAGSFSAANIEKTVADFEGLEARTLTLDNERGINAYSRNSFTGYVLLICAILIAVCFFEERKKGLWQFLYVLPQGRERLAARRCLILFLGVLASGVLLEGQSLVLIGLTNGGFGDLSRAVQSNANFSGCTGFWSMGQYLLLSVGIKILVAFLFGMFFWILMSAAKNYKISFGITILFVALEYYAYMTIQVQSSWNFWKYMNVFAFLDSPVILVEYRNLNIGGVPVHVLEILGGLLSVFLVLLGIGCILMGYQKPFAQKAGMLEKLLGNFRMKLKPYSHGSIFLHECYKVLVQQRAALVLVLLIVIAYADSKPQKMFYDYKSNIYNSYLNQIQGPVDEDKVEYLESERQLWEEKIKRSEEKIAAYDALMYDETTGDCMTYEEPFINEEAYAKEKKKLAKYYEALEVVQELCVEAQRLDKLQKEQGNAGFVNKIGYQRYVGEYGEVMAERNALICLVVLVMALGGMESFELSQNARPFLRATRYGRKRLFDAKCMVALVFTLGISVCINYSEYCFIDGTYGLTQQTLSVQSLDMFAEFPLDLSIIGMLQLVWLLRFVMLAAVAMLILLLSEKAHNTLIALFAGTSLIVFPAALVYAGVQALAPVSVLKPVTVICSWNQYGFDSVMWCLPLAVLVVIGTVVWFWRRGHV